MGAQADIARRARWTTPLTYSARAGHGDAHALLGERYIQQSSRISPIRLCYILGKHTAVNTPRA